MDDSGPRPANDRDPCGTWSSDGRWIVTRRLRQRAAPTTPRLRHCAASVRRDVAEGIWIVDTTRQAVKRLDGFQATDIEWSPDGTELAIGTDRLLYSVGADSFGPSDRFSVRQLSWSPDGQRLASDRTRRNAGLHLKFCPSRGPCRAIGRGTLDGRGRRGGETLIAADYEVDHGMDLSRRPMAGTSPTSDSARHIRFDRTQEPLPRAARSHARAGQNRRSDSRGRRPSGHPSAQDQGPQRGRVMVPVDGDVVARWHATSLYGMGTTRPDRRGEEVVRRTIGRRRAAVNLYEGGSRLSAGRRPSTRNCGG